MRRRLPALSRLLAWAAIGLSAVAMLVWFLHLPAALGIQSWEPSEEVSFATVLIRVVLFGGWLLVRMFSHYVPLYGADAFLWFGVRGALKIEERRGFWLTMCGFGVLVSAAVIAWYVRESVLLLTGIFS